MGHPGETPLPSRTWERAPGEQKTHLPPQVPEAGAPAGVANALMSPHLIL